MSYARAQNERCGEAQLLEMQLALRHVAEAARTVLTMHAVPANSGTMYRDNIGAMAALRKTLDSDFVRAALAKVSA